MTELRKCNALGNDFLILDCMTIPKNAEFITQENIKKISHRRFGIGCDQFIVLEKSEKSDGKIVFYNSDGSRAEACGNGTIACGVYIARMLEKDIVFLETDIKIAKVSVDGNEATVELPRAEILDINIERFKNSLNKKNDDSYGYDLSRNRISPFKLTSVSVGNPHCVLFLEHFDGATVNMPELGSNKSVDTIFMNMGSIIENMTDLFPNRTNVEFVVRTGENAFDCFIWERGSGATLACGTGACAVARAVADNGLVDGTKPVFITMAGSYQSHAVIPMKVELKDDCTLFTNRAEFTGIINL